MKKTVLKLLLLLLAAAVVMAVCVYLQAGQLQLYFEIPPEATAATVSFDPEGILETEGLAYDFDTGRCCVSLKALQAGATNAVLRWDRVDDSGFYSAELAFPVKVLKGGIILDTVTLNFSGWENLVLVIEVTLLAGAVILFYAFLQKKRSTGFFSYESVRLLGFGIFLLILGIVRISSAVTVITTPDSGTVWSLLMGLVSSAQQFAVRTAPVVIAFAVAVGVSNIVLIRKEGFFRNNLFALATGILMAAGAAGGIVLYYSRLTILWSNELINIYAGVFVYFECHLAATVACGLLAGYHTPDYDKDFILILGCKVRPDGTLYPLIRSRVERALQFAEEQFRRTGKQAVFVPSGGKGSDECCSEADAMALYLKNRGIPQERIRVENRSCNTRENMTFSRHLIGEIVPENRIAFATSSYHVFRSGVLAGKLDWHIDGMGSRTRWFFWPNAFLREFIGMLADSWVSQLLSLVIIAVVSYAIMQIV